MGFDVASARAAFAHVFQTTDGSSIAVNPSGDATAQGVSEAFLRALVDDSLGSAVGHTSLSSSGFASCGNVTPLAMYKLAMFAVLGSFASTTDEPAAWVKVAYNPSDNRLQLLPSAAETRQLFADVLVVLAIVTLFRTWLRVSRMTSVEK